MIVRSTIELAHNLGLTVVAEGVEDDLALDMLGKYAVIAPRDISWVAHASPTKSRHGLTRASHAPPNAAKGQNVRLSGHAARPRRPTPPPWLRADRPGSRPTGTCASTIGTGFSTATISR